MLTRTLNTLILTAVFAGAAAGTRNENEWANVQGIARGTHVEVIDRGMKHISGAFISASANEINVFENHNQETISKLDVVRITAGGGARRKHALVGLAVGAAVAAAMSAASGSQDKATGNDVPPKGAVVVGATAGGAAVGALVGTTLRSSHTLYRIESRPQASR